MLETARGTIDIKRSMWNDSVLLEFKSRYEDEDVYLVSLDERNLDRMIKQLTQKREEIEQWKRRRSDLVRTVNFHKLYRELHEKYFPYPYDPAPASIFGDGLNGGDITEEVFYAAMKYYGKLWDYAGD